MQSGEEEEVEPNVFQIRFLKHGEIALCVQYKQVFWNISRKY